MTEKQKRAQSENTVLMLRRIIGYIFLVVLSILCLFSFYILLINSTRMHSEIAGGFSLLPGKYLFKNIANLSANQNLPVFRSLFNSLFVAGLTAVVSTYFSGVTAYGIHCYDFKGKKAAFTFILMIMMVPTQVSAIGFIRLMNAMKLDNTFLPLIVPSIAAPIVFFFMKQYMESSLPLEIVEAARIDGSNEFATYNVIVLPILKPAIAVQAIFTFTASWNNYFMPALILTEKDRKTLPILIAMLRSADFLKFDLGQVYMLIAFAIFPVVVVYLALSKNIVQGVALGSVKG